MRLGRKVVVEGVMGVGALNGGGTRLGSGVLLEMFNLGEAEALKVEVVVEPRGRILLPFLLAMLRFRRLPLGRILGWYPSRETGWGFRGLWVRVSGGLGLPCKRGE